MWLVRYALTRPYSVAALSLLIFAAGLISYLKLPVDVLPSVNIPSIKVVWTYNGLNTNEMASKITTFSEVAIMNNVDNLKEIRSQTLNGVSVIHIDFHPEVDIANAMAQVTGVSQTIRRRMPEGTSPPLVAEYNQSSTPIIQLVMSSDTLTDGQLADFARLQLRGMVQSINGIRMTLPYGGATRQIMVDLDPEALFAQGLTANDVTQAINEQNLTLPSGSIREAQNELQITVNASPQAVADFEDLPIRSRYGELILLRDVANVRDGTALQTNIARVNGENAVMVSLIKLGGASTVEIINELTERLPSIQAAAPEGITISPIFDQSVFVSTALHHIEMEIIIVGSLVALMVLLFLGSSRATLIVLTSIPLSLLTAVFVLNLTGNTLNLMSLGGLALAIGILVDNALVEIENIKRHLADGMEPSRAILTSASEVAFPEFVSTLSTCIVFSPIFLLTGVAGFIFQPMAIVVIACLAASYLLSRTVVPTLAKLLLSNEKTLTKQSKNPLVHVHLALEQRLHNGQQHLQNTISRLQRHILVAPLIGIVIVTAAGFALQEIGRDFFPKTDAGLMRFYMRVDTGSRIEQTAEKFAQIQQEIRKIIPEDELDFVFENIGMPDSINRAWIESFTIGTYDGELQIQLAKGHQPSSQYESAIRQMLKEKFPEVTLFSQAADTTNQTLSGSTPTALDVRFTGRNLPASIAKAEALIEKMQDVDGAVDIGFQQVFALPEYYVNLDRKRAAELGVTTQAAINSLLGALGSAGTVAPSFWSDPVFGFSYEVQTRTPLHKLSSTDDLMNLQVQTDDPDITVPLASIASITPRNVAGSIGRTMLKPTVNVLINTENTDLGSVYQATQQIVNELKQEMVPGNDIEIMGQASAMDEAYRDLLFGFLLAVFFIYIIMLFNFASWIMPLVALSGAPIAISGAIIGLMLTGTTISVPALMGFIMVIGVSTANSVLVTTFARDQWVAGKSAFEAAREAASTRLRPVLMTALTMIIGLLPMALALGEGGEQNAPLARTVIGGLMLGTFASLFLVPWTFSMIMQFIKRPQPVKLPTI